MNEGRTTALVTFENINPTIWLQCSVANSSVKAKEGKIETLLS